MTPEKYVDHRMIQVDHPKQAPLCACVGVGISGIGGGGFSLWARGRVWIWVVGWRGSKLSHGHRR